MRHYFLGMAAEYADGEWFRHLFTIGRKNDHDKLMRFLSKKYSGEAMLCKNGRSALALALKAYFEPGDEILVNGFTCYAVYEAIKAAGLKPIFVDISRDSLNFNTETLNAILDDSRLAPARPSTKVVRQSSSQNEQQVVHSLDFSDGLSRGSGAQSAPVVADGLESSKTRIRGIIIQNTLGNPVDIKAVEKFAKENDLIIIEDLAHCAGVKYPDGREAGTVGVATALSFGKDKSIDAVSGGAVIFREEKKHDIKAPFKSPKPTDHLRARFYPMFGALCRSLTYIGIGGALMRMLVKIHFVEKSADSKLDIERLPSKFEAVRALRQLKELRRNGESPMREFCFVHDRAELLKKLQKKGYYFGGLWYEKPVSPERYYNKVHFPEEKCPNALYVSEHIINLPIYYTKRDLNKALKIIEPYLEKGDEHNE